jgi:Flp pilus assembly protein CpaB
MPPIRDRVARALRPVRRAVLRRRRLLAAVLTAVAVASGIHAAAAPPPARVGVPVAAHDLPAGVVLSAGDLTEVEFAPDSVPDGVAADAAGRTLAAPLRRGEPVTDVRLVGRALADGRADLTALPVRLPDPGMVDLLRAGDRIDLLAADPQGSGARTVATDVLVLAVPRATAANGAGTTGGRLVVVGVHPEEVPDVADAAVRFFLTFAFAR